MKLAEQWRSLCEHTGEIWPLPAQYFNNWTVSKCEACGGPTNMCIASEKPLPSASCSCKDGIGYRRAAELLTVGIWHDGNRRQWDGMMVVVGKHLRM